MLSHPLSYTRSATQFEVLVCAKLLYLYILLEQWFMIQRLEVATSKTSQVLLYVF